MWRNGGASVAGPTAPVPAMVVMAVTVSTADDVVRGRQ